MSNDTYEFKDGFSATLKIEGGEADFHKTKIETLVQALDSIQKTAYLLAAAKTDQSVGVRYKPSNSVKDEYAILCGTPFEGSYALPLTSDLHSDEFNLGEPNLIEQIQQVWTAVCENNLEVLKKLFPSKALQERFLREFQKIIPKVGSPYTIGLQDQTCPNPVLINSKTAKVVKEWLNPSSQEDANMTVTGELVRIDFAKKVVTIQYYPTRQEIDCVYLPEIEENIIESRTEPIQVTGRFTLDAGGNPTRLTEVTRIEALDLSPILIEEVSLDALTIKFHQPLCVEPSLDEENRQYLEVTIPELDLFTFGLNREILYQEIENEIRFLWTEIVRAQDKDLDSNALRVKQTLVSMCTISENQDGDTQEK